MSATAKLFMHGEVRPCAAEGNRFAGREVRVTKVGDRVILEPLASAAAMPWYVFIDLGTAPLCRRPRAAAHVAGTA